VIGSIHEHTIREIALSHIRREMREAMLQGRRKDIPLCRNCTGFYRPSPTRKNS